MVASVTTAQLQGVVVGSDGKVVSVGKDHWRNKRRPNVSSTPVGWQYDPEVDAGTLSLRDLRPDEILAGGVEISLGGNGVVDLVVHLDQLDRVVEIEFFGVRTLLPHRFIATDEVEL